MLDRCTTTRSRLQLLTDGLRQGKQNRLLFPLPNRGASGDHGIVRCKERLGGLLKYYEREAA